MRSHLLEIRMKPVASQLQCMYENSLNLSDAHKHKRDVNFNFNFSLCIHCCVCACVCVGVCALGGVGSLSCGSCTPCQPAVCPCLRLILGCMSGSCFAFGATVTV